MTQEEEPDEPKFFSLKNKPEKVVIERENEEHSDTSSTFEDGKPVSSVADNQEDLELIARGNYFS